MADWLRRIWGWSNWGAWGLLILLLPITSLPLLARLARSETVAVASAIPLAWLVVAWFIPYLVRGGRLPRVALPLLGLVTVMVISSAAAFFIDIPPFKDKSVLGRELQAFITLGIGLAFYLVTSAWADTPRKLRITLMLVNLSGLILIGWSLVQAYYWFKVGSVPQAFTNLQRQISLTGVFVRRVNGLAYEPSWLAHQLNLVYLPWWLAASVRRTSAHPWRVLGISVENVLLALGALVLFLSFSRVGLLAFLLMLAFLALRATLWMVSRVRRWLAGRMRRGAAEGWFGSVALPAGLLLAFATVYLAGALGVVFVASRYDPRLARLFETPLTGESIYAFANRLVFAERLVYWATGWGIFGQHPLLGVGLGNAGYFFQEHMPAYGWALTEVNNLMYRLQVIPNTKSLWTRLLAETGLVGFAFWLAWYYLLWKAGSFLSACRGPVVKTLGLMGALALVSLLVEGFSVDSFALPYLWFTMGLISAASRAAWDEAPAPGGVSIAAEQAEGVAQ